LSQGPSLGRVGDVRLNWPVLGWGGGGQGPLVDSEPEANLTQLRSLTGPLTCPQLKRASTTLPKLGSGGNAVPTDTRYVENVDSEPLSERRLGLNSESARIELD
jgi:hypothetical protein